MLKHLGGRKTSAVLIFLVCSLYLGIWIDYVNPFADRDSVNQFYFPFLNYLKASTTEIGNDLFFLRGLISVEYPWGSLLMPALIALLGLQETFLAQPWLLSGVLLAALVLSAVLVGIPVRRRYLFATSLFFFPLTQIALKNFNLHSFNVLLFFCAISLFLTYLESKQKKFLYPSLILFWFSCIVKHLGILLFVIAWFAYLIWKTHRLERIQKEVIAGFALLAAALPFYPLSGYLSYLNGVMGHNPNLNFPQLLVFGIIVSLGLSFYWFDLASKQVSRKQAPRTLESGIFFLILNMLLLWIVSLDSSFHPIFWMVFWLLFSFFVVTAYLKKFAFQNLDGLKSLLVILLLCLPLVLYFSRLAQVALLFVPGLYLMLRLYFERYNSRIGPIVLTLSCIIGSNFFPDLESLEGSLGKYGFGIYARGMNTLQQNFLGWKKSELRPLRDDMMRVLARLDDSSNDESLIMLHPYQHSHRILSLQFSDQLLFSVPTVLLLEQVPEDPLQKLDKQVRQDKNAVFQKLFEDCFFPLILMGRDSWSQYLKWEENPLQLPENYNRRRFIQWLHIAYWKFLVDRGLLRDQFDLYSLGSGSKEKLLLFVQKTLPRKSEATLTNSKRLEALISQYRELKYPGVKIARLLFEKASGFFDQRRMLEACALLELAAGLDPTHGEVLQDLTIVKESLSTEQLLSLSGKQFQKIISDIYPGMEILIGWDKGFD